MLGVISGNDGLFCMSQSKQQLQAAEPSQVLKSGGPKLKILSAQCLAARLHINKYKWKWKSAVFT